MEKTNVDNRQLEIDAWELMVTEHQCYISGLVNHLCHNRDDADDIVQDTFLKAFKSYANFRGDSSIRTWLSRIAINTFVESNRKKSKHEPINLSAIPASTNDPEKVVVRREMQWCIRHILQQHLPEDYKIVMVLRDIYGFSYKEIAETLRISLAAVKSRLHRGRKRFLEHLQKAGCVAFVKDYSCYCEEAKNIWHAATV